MHLRRICSWQTESSYWWNLGRRLARIRQSCHAHRAATQPCRAFARHDTLATASHNVIGNKRPAPDSARRPGRLSRRQPEWLQAGADDASTRLGVREKLNLRTDAMRAPSRLDVHQTARETHRAGSNPMSEHQQHRMRVRMLAGGGAAGTKKRLPSCLVASRRPPPRSRLSLRETRPGGQTSVGSVLLFAWALLLGSIVQHRHSVGPPSFQ